jgi:hypothetical protein
MKNYLINILVRLFGLDLQSQTAKALKTIQAGNSRIDAARQALADTQASALAAGKTALATLQETRTEAEEAEQAAEKARQGQVSDFDSETAREVAALKEKLRILQQRRADKKASLTTVLEAERREAAKQDAAAEAAEAEIAELLAALESDVDAQNGLNEASGK